MDDFVAEAEARWGITLKHKIKDEWVGPCPFCGYGTDRFHVWADVGNYWCRQCGASGWVVDNEELSEHELRLRRLEAKQRELERRQKEMEERLSALERMHKCTDHVRYYHNLTPEAVEYWVNEGIELETIDKYMLGYCDRCPTDKDGRPSYTIPVMAYGKLWNIRHRLIGADNGDKYRPHMAGLPAMLFNADYLKKTDTNWILITEGEKKSIVAAQYGFPNVGLMGKSGFKKEWVKKFDRFRTIYVVMDPDATDKAVEIGGLFGRRGRVVELPAKLDDMFAKYGATKDDVEWFIRVAKPVGEGRGYV